jgi:NAD(P)-dependent dehydrogenase (short-subunit alcohol dehydrogenase family)
MTKSSRIFITGSADGLGLMAAKLLIGEGHSVVLHARSESRANDVRKAIPEAKEWVIGDLSSIAETKSVAEQVNRLGHFDAVIHNAAVGYRENTKVLTKDGLPHVFAINTLAPYILTCLIKKPKRLIYLSSGLHHSANTSLDDLLWEQRPWRGSEAYSETKFHDVLIAFAAARLWPDVLSNALEPGWVPTKMGGSGAPDDLNEGYRTQAWLAVSDEPLALKSGEYYYHRKLRPPNPETRDLSKQDELLAQCHKFSGAPWPR